MPLRQRYALSGPKHIKIVAHNLELWRGRRPALRVLLALERGVERGVVEDVLDGLAVDEGEREELVNRGDELGAVDEVVLLVATAGVLRAPGLVVAIREVIDAGAIFM